MSGMICGMFVGGLLMILFLVWLLKKVFTPPIA
jgi:flagellar biogenesis protein FliO